MIREICQITTHRGNRGAPDSLRHVTSRSTGLDETMTVPIAAARRPSAGLGAGVMHTPVHVPGLGARTATFLAVPPEPELAAEVRRACVEQLGLGESSGDLKPDGG